jgi:hypothetical protein
MVSGQLVAGILCVRPSRAPRWLGPLLLVNIAVLAVSFDTLGLAFFGVTWVMLAASSGLRLRAE